MGNINTRTRGQHTEVHLFAQTLIQHRIDSEIERAVATNDYQALTVIGESLVELSICLGGVRWF